MQPPTLSRATSGFAERARQEAENNILKSVDDIPEEFKKKYDKSGLEVGIAMKVISISQLDIANNTFTADFNLNVAWKGKKEDKPEIQLYNQSEEHEDKDESDVKPGSAGFDFYYRVRCKATFRQHYFLQAFPFDEQELTVRVRVKTECRLVHLPWGPTGDAASCDPGAIEEDFMLKEAVVRPKYLPSYKFGKLGGYDPEAQVVFIVRRRPEYWIYNYAYLMSIVCSFAFAAFALPTSDVGDRLGVGFTLNLTVVATFYLMQDKLPTCSYYTELERHMVACIGFTMLVMFLNCLPAFFGFMERIEIFITLALIIGWVGYHAHMYARCSALVQREVPPTLHESLKRASGSPKRESKDE